MKKKAIIRSVESIQRRLSNPKMLHTQWNSMNKSGFVILQSIACMLYESDSTDSMKIS